MLLLSPTHSCSPLFYCANPIEISVSKPRFRRGNQLLAIGHSSRGRDSKTFAIDRVMNWVPACFEVFVRICCERRFNWRGLSFGLNQWLKFVAWLALVVDR